MSAFKKSFDNITAVMLTFDNFENVAGEVQSVDSDKIMEFKHAQLSLDPVEEELIETDEIATPFMEEDDYLILKSR